MAPPARSDSGLTLREEIEEGRFSLQLSPSRLYALPVVLFTFLWLRFLWRWYALITLASDDDARGFLALFGLPFLLAGLSLVTTSLRLALGRSVVMLDGTRMVVAEQSLFDVLTPTLVTPMVRIIGFAAGGSGAGDPDQELDVWQVNARLDSGENVPLPLPVRSLAEAEGIARRLDRGLASVRAPKGYRDGLASLSVHEK